MELNSGLAVRGSVMPGYLATYGDRPEEHCLCAFGLGHPIFGRIGRRMCAYTLCNGKHRPPWHSDLAVVILQGRCFSARTRVAVIGTRTNLRSDHTS